MELKVIKSERDYHLILQEAEELVARDPGLGSKDADRLELLTVLIEDYERRQFPFETPGPIDAIEFRMQEQGLRQRDLVPLIGSRSRVSEVLARKRPLTVQMIRSLSLGLGIPLEALIAEQSTTSNQTVAPDDASLDWSKFPIREMQKRGWLASAKARSASVEELVKDFLGRVSSGATSAALYRRNFRGEKIDPRAYYSTLAWTARVLIQAKERTPPVKFDARKITPELLRDLARLSWLSEGPTLAREFLEKVGIVLVIEPRLPNTLLDGAAMLTDRNVPVIGLTLRHDRIDYFWFTLLHECVHVSHHLNSKDDAFVDRVESMGAGATMVAEKEANRIARDSFIPRGIWKRSRAFLAPSTEHIRELADELHIHPAIVVGRLQFETGRYESFREFLGQGSVRRCFPNIAFT